MLTTTDPRTGDSAAIFLDASTTADVDRTVRDAVAASTLWARHGREGRARLLDALATETEVARDDLVATAAGETGLTEARLAGEVGRCVWQFSMFAAAVREGSLVEAVIDHAGDTPLGPGPDVRRMLVPLGPVAVFGASNFPFAFSVLGGDVAAAVAAGCPVVLKAHGSHLLTSRRSHEVLTAAAHRAGLPEALLGIVFGQRAGVDLVTHPDVRAAGFTGSLGAARALMTAIEARPDPIPFYGELSSTNPLVVTPAAAAARAESIADGLFASFTGSAGQLCTKPGVAFVPAGADGEALLEALVHLTEGAASPVLLNDRIRDSYVEIADRLVRAGALTVGQGPAADEPGFRVAPRVLATTAAELDPELAEECFGPLLVVARYDDLGEVREALLRMPRSLTATVHHDAATPGEHDVVAALLPVLEAVSGRVVFDGFPTGVRVCWAQNHGGPWPATNTQHTSVGVTAVRRFQRPLAWQDAPAASLPVELRDGTADLPRRIDGVLVPAGSRPESGEHR